MKKRLNKKRELIGTNYVRGFTLFISIVVMGTLLLLATGVVSLATRQTTISASGRESQHAFYAADTGIECAIYWDVQNEQTGVSAFSPSTPSTIFCNKDINNTNNEWIVGGGEVSVISHIYFLPDPYCARVTVTKDPSGGTRIESLGYNTCDVENPRRVERAVRVQY